MDVQRSKFVSDIIRNAWVAWKDGIVYSTQWRVIFSRLFFDYIGGNAYSHVLIVIILCSVETREDRLGIIRSLYPTYLWLCGYGASAKAMFYLVWFGIPALIQLTTIALVCQLYYFVFLHGLEGVFGALSRITALIVAGDLAINVVPVLQDATFSVARFCSARPWLRLGHIDPLLSNLFEILEILIFSNLSVLFQYSLYQRRQKRTKSLDEPVDCPKGTPDYCYKDLAGGEIRLLHIFPDPDSGVPKYSLVNTPLENAPSYHAISYVWGCDEKSHGLVVDDKWLQTTRSAFEILHDHALYWSRGLDSFFWIDSLCINQMDMNERGQQVRMMGSIYSNAIDVIAFLRPDDYEEVETAACFFANLMTDVTRKRLRSYGPPTFGHGYFNHAVVHMLINLVATITDSVPSPGWDALCKIFGHRYWNRMWIVQELILASELRVFHGENELDWRSLQRFAAGDLKDSRYIDLSYANSVREEGIESSRNRILHTLLQRMSYKAGRTLHFRDLLMSCRSKNAGDPRDKVFALYGLLDIKEIPESILPDYTKSVRALYTDLATYFITEGHLEWLLCMASPGYVGSQGHDEGSCPDCKSKLPLCDCHQLPSWVPDWSHPYPVALPNALLKPISESEGLGGNMMVSVIGGSLSVSSLAVGRIERLETLHLSTQGRDMKETNTAVLHLLKTFRALLHALDTLPSTYPTGEATIDALARTIIPECCDEVIESFRRSWVVCKSFGPRLESFEDGVELTSFNDGLINGTALREICDSLAKAGIDYWSRRTVHCSMRRLAITESGFFALVPQYAQIGDVIHTLQGAGAGSFFVLRDMSEGKFKLIGDCYLHGFLLPLDREMEPMEIQ